MTCPRAGFGIAGSRRGTWTAWTWIADHPQHCEGAATIGLELVDTVRSVGQSDFWRVDEPRTHIRPRPGRSQVHRLLGLCRGGL